MCSSSELAVSEEYKYETKSEINKEEKLSCHVTSMCVGKTP